MDDVLIDTSAPLWQLWTSPFQAWNPDLLRQAKTTADTAGDMSLVADLWESMLGDDRVSGAIEQRILASESLPLTFQGAARAVKRLQEWWPNVITPGIRAELLRWGLGVGICPLYIRSWENGVPTDLEIFHPRYLRYFFNERRWKLLTLGGLIDVDSCPGRLYLFAPFSSPYARPWVSGIWYSTCTAWLGKAYAYPDMANFGQQHASPKWFLENIDGNATITKAQKLEAMQWLSRVPSRATMFVPYPFKVTQHETNSSAWQAFVKQIDMANASLARRILGHDASMDKDATHASAMSALDIKMSLVRFDVDAEGSFWHKGLIKTWAAVQGIASVPLPIRDTTPPEDLAQASTVQAQAAGALKTLQDAGVADMIDLRSYLGRYFPLKEQDGTTDEDTPTDGIQLELSQSDGPSPLLLAASRQETTSQYRDRMVEALEDQPMTEDAFQMLLTLVEQTYSQKAAQAELLQNLPQIEESGTAEALACALLLTQAEGMLSVGEHGEVREKGE
jgi:hypothetical protein